MSSVTVFRKNMLSYGVFVGFLAFLVGCVLWLAGDESMQPVELRTWQFLVVVATMLAVNLAVLFVLITVIRWKRVTENGMMAIVPQDVVETSNASLEATSKMAAMVNTAFNEISKHLKNSGDSVHILKHELKLKEDELASLKGGAAQAEREKVTNKLAKVHSFLRKLEVEVTEKRMDASAAIRFLNDEVEDLFEEFGLYELKVADGVRVSELEPDSYAIKAYEDTTNQSEHMTVIKVLEPGYGATRSNGSRRIVKPSVVIVKKLGE